VCSVISASDCNLSFLIIVDDELAWLWFFPLIVEGSIQVNCSVVPSLVVCLCFVDFSITLPV